MKTIILNASPRKKRNTAQLLKYALRGAEAAGAETEYIDLYDLKFSGCRSCLACKKKGIGEPCRCYWKDELSPVLASVYQADRLIIGTPIYYGEPTGMLRCFMERLTFPAMSYNDYSSTMKGKVDVDVILTMNAGEQFFEQKYARSITEYFGPMRFLNGEVRMHPVCDTLQVDDYSKFDMASFDEAHKKAVHDTNFPAELEKAYQLGMGK